MRIYAGLLLTGAVSLALAGGCNPPADYALVGSAYVPAAQGDIHIEKIDKQQRLIVVALDHLPPPGEVEPGMNHYVVWFSAVGEYPAPQQALEYDSEKRTGRAALPTSMQELDVKITAEQTERPTQPSDFLIASQQIREN